MDGHLMAVEELKTIMEFQEQDLENLAKMGPLFKKHQAKITARFYDVLKRFPISSQLIDGRLDSLKKSHTSWFNSLFSGKYGQDYFESRWRMSKAHAALGMEFHWLEAMMNLVRTQALQSLSKEVSDLGQFVIYSNSLLKILDVDLAIMNLAYSDSAVERIAAFTGMKAALVENIFRPVKK